MYSEAEIDTSAAFTLIYNHFIKLLNVYLLYFISLARFIFKALISSLSVIPYVVFSAQDGQKNAPFPARQLVPSGKGVRFPIIYSLTLRWPESAAAVPAAD